MGMSTIDIMVKYKTKDKESGINIRIFLIIMSNISCSGVPAFTGALGLAVAVETLSTNILVVLF